MKNVKTNVKSPKISKVFVFTRKILDDIHDLFSECVSFPKKINNQFWCVTVFSKEK